MSIREDVLRKRYFLKDENGEVIEDWEGLCTRVAGAVSQNEKECKDFYEVLHECLFLPNTPALTNAGKEKFSMSACFVLPVEDSMEGIFEAVKQAALIHKYGGGTGFSFSRLRPNGDMVGSTKGVASGPCSFIRVFDTATDVTKQGGARRGANIGILKCLSGNTLIHTIEGKLPIKELIGKRPYVYACDIENRQVHIVQADGVIISDHNRELIRVWLVNGDYIDCTPDHQFLMSTGIYKEAEKLMPGDSLMAFHKSMRIHAKNTRITIGCTGGRARLEHHAVAEDIYGRKPEYRGCNAHHIDGNSLNNHPHNIKPVSRNDHALKHIQNLLAVQRKIAARRRGKTLKEIYGQEKAKQWQEKLSKAKKGKLPWNKNIESDKYRENYPEGFKNQYSNHRVIRVEKIGFAEEVYDIMLPQYHNFAVNGVFVHNCSHPDIMEFIALKKEEGKLPNFNLSVGITDEFMKALKEEGNFDLVFNGRVRKTVKAKEIWDAIVDGAWENGEPGVVFLDTINRGNPTPHIGQIEATNPCVTGDTLVATPNGGQRPAHSFTTGDEILTVHGTIGKVKQIEIHPNMDVYRVTFSDGGAIKVTLAHQFYARNRYSANEDFTPIALKDLYTGDVVKKFKGPAVRIISIIHAGKTTVYDLYEPYTDTWITNGYVSVGCGEQPLLPREACVLGSINLSKMADKNEVNREKLGVTVQTAVRFLDNIIDAQYYPIPEIERMHKANRKIGLGVMGWADMLIKLGIPYNSDEAIKLAEEVMGFIASTSIEESKRLAEQKGVFPNWEGSAWQKKGIRLRNATTTTIAPTGSISLIAGSSSGIEPIFDFVTIQKRPVGEHKVIHPLYEEWVRNNGDKPLPPYFVTAKEIPYQWHIKMQAAFQRHTHNAVSKTINLPNNSTKEDIASAFLTAYELGCKGVTVYRDGSRQKQVISSAKVAKAASDDLPPVMDAKRVCIDTSEGKVYVNVSLSAANDPVEVFITTPVESRFAEVYESFGRIFSVALRNGTPVKKLLSQLEKANRKYGSVSSIPAAIIRAFRMLGINGGPGESCPDCGSVLVLQEGCIKCITCGYTKC